MQAGVIGGLLALTLSLANAAPASADQLLHEDQSVLSVDERPIRFYVDRPALAQKLPILLVVDGSGCIGQLRPSSWGNFAPGLDDAVPYARLMVEKPGVEPTANDLDAECSEEFLRNYSIEKRVLDHLRVLQHLTATADWWNGDIYLWGWSDGGDIAAQLVVYRPDIKRAVLGAMGGGLTMAEHFEDFWACPPETTPDRQTCLADLREDFRRMEDNPTWRETWAGKDNSWRVWATRLRSRLTAPLADNRVPILIVHGELDRDSTPVESARKLVAHLQDSGNPAFTYWEIAGMEHGWNNLPQPRQQAIVSAMADWLLTGEVDPRKRSLAVDGVAENR